MLALATLILMATLALAGVLSLRPDLRERLLERLGHVRPWQVGLAAMVVAFLVLEGPSPYLFALATALALFVLAWLRQFAFLMQLGDDAFPGRNDKLIWALLLIVLPPIGVLAFRSYREAHWPRTKPSHAEARHDLA
jgi:hypothetical protein